MSRSRVMKQDPTSRKLDSYSLRKMTAVPATLTSTYRDSIGGNASELEREAYMRGFSTGEQAGKDQGLKEVGAKFHFLNEMIEKLKIIEQEIIKRSHHDVLQISLEVAKQIVNGEIQQKPEKIQSYIREAAEKMAPSDHFIIRLNPVDKTSLGQTEAAVLKDFDEIKSVRIETDPGLQPGECILETHAHMVDGRFERQLAIFRTAFLNSMETN